MLPDRYDPSDADFVGMGVDYFLQAPGALHETTVWVKMSQDVYDRFDKKGEGYQ